MGGEQVTIKNVHVISINDKTNEISISSPIPGRVGIFMKITKIKEGTLKELQNEVVEHVIESEKVNESVDTAQEAATVLEEATN